LAGTLRSATYTAPAVPTATAQGSLSPVNGKLGGVLDTGLSRPLAQRDGVPAVGGAAVHRAHPAGVHRRGLGQRSTAPHLGRRRSGGAHRAGARRVQGRTGAERAAPDGRRRVHPGATIDARLRADDDGRPATARRATDSQPATAVRPLGADDSPVAR
jgi:hypothetical protein